MSIAARPLGKAVATAATLTPLSPSVSFAIGDHVRVDADRGGRRAGRVGRVGAHRLGGEGAHLAGGVLALERGEVDHPDRQVDGVLLGGGLDRPGAELRCPRLGADLVHTREPVEEAPQRGVGRGDLGEVAGSEPVDAERGGRHPVSIGPCEGPGDNPVDRHQSVLTNISVHF